MAEPSKKDPGITRLLESKFGRTTAIRADICVNPPMGCGGPAERFRDDLSKKEYTINGLCQYCQDEVFR